MNESGGGLRPFTAELGMCEIDERGRTGSTWPVRASGISRSRVVVLSRRMCYHGSSVAVGIHLVDDEPFVLIGRVASCEYDQIGLYLIEIALEPKADRALAAELRLVFAGQSAA